MKAYFALLTKHHPNSNRDGTIQRLRKNHADHPYRHIFSEISLLIHYHFRN